jgi:hypothetical protein
MFATRTRRLSARLNITYGITANNSPTVQDPWNTTPVWGFPYVLLPFTAGFGPTPIIDGAFAAHVGSVGGYVYLNDLIYLEASVYRTLSPGAQSALGADPFDAPGLLDASPYWRAAIEPHWGPHWLEVGTFGMIAPTCILGSMLGRRIPRLSHRPTNSPISAWTRNISIKASNFWFTLRGSYIHEIQKLDASFNNGLAANPKNELNEARAYASLAYGDNNRIVLTGQYFTSWGSPDSLLFSPDAGFSNFSPDTNGWIAEIAYIPFVSSFSPGWPWLNARIGLQYTWYERFNGTSAGASSNNALFAYIWLAM